MLKNIFLEGTAVFSGWNWKLDFIWGSNFLPFPRLSKTSLPSTVRVFGCLFDSKIPRFFHPILSLITTTVKFLEKSFHGDPQLLAWSIFPPIPEGRLRRHAFQQHDFLQNFQNSVFNSSQILWWFPKGKYGFRGSPHILWSPSTIDNQFVFACENRSTLDKYVRPVFCTIIFVNVPSIISFSLV